MMATLALMMMMVVMMMMMVNQDCEDDCHVMIFGLITFECTYCGKCYSSSSDPDTTRRKPCMLESVVVVGCGELTATWGARRTFIGRMSFQPCRAQGRWSFGLWAWGGFQSKAHHK